MGTLLGDYAAAGGAAVWLLAAALGLFAVLAVLLCAEDLRSHRLPNRLVLPAYPAATVLLGGAAAAAGEAGRTVAMLAGAAVLWLGYFLLRLISPAGLGYGDVKLAGVLGLYLGFLGWSHVLAGTMAAFLIGGLWAGLLVAFRRATLKSAIAFGPCMLLGAAVAMLLPVPG
ncbi:Type IV leader peptidase family protein [Arthrobacter saudimassiliensis]|uniref:Type IV leader peptidase family protein n=1 Tax=Arthrobacter saudimassiliensis TaxID=1461584 RepID=A0A078MME7_9MICC|nr:Type IV leader peptidase family protein [Arthrobacter saudimassiliensis]